MRRILLVKTSSMGDVIHNLPVVSDLKQAFPGACIDWVVEESFAEIPALHPGVTSVIPVAIRRWRKHLGQGSTFRELSEFKHTLRSQNYDAILDSQGLLKSALITRMARGVRHGYDRKSAREPVASWFYHRTHNVPRQRHAVERNRLLAAAAFEYPIDAHDFSYGLRIPESAPSRPPTGAYCILLHATSRDDKRWSNEYWVEMGNWLHSEFGLRAILPWGNATERSRSDWLSQCIPESVVPQRLGLTTLASLLAGADIVIGVDTGLTHLAAAIARPTIALYCASDPGLTGVYAPNEVINLGGATHSPTLSEVRQAVSALLEKR